MLNADMIYEAADYLRLSKEDGDFSLSNDKLESDSISSQRAIIERFVAQNPNIKLVAEFWMTVIPEQILIVRTSRE